MPGVPCRLYLYALAAATMAGLSLNFYVSIQQQLDVRTAPGLAGYADCVGRAT
jgi:hypothetical protein